MLYSCATDVLLLRTIAQTGPLADLFRHRFSSKHFDVEAGLYYYGYRFYSPVLRRWPSRDLIEENGGLNLYVFCMNNSLNCFDVLGNAHFEVRALHGMGAILKYSCFAAIIGSGPSAVLDLGLADKLNVEILHEHLFYDDGGNIGYHEDGYFEEPSKKGYSRRDHQEYDDCIMHGYCRKVGDGTSGRVDVLIGPQRRSNVPCAVRAFRRDGDISR